MANIEELTACGYIFATYEDAETAQNEAKKIAYLESHSDMSNVSVILALYDKALESRMFATPVGLEYLHSLQKILRDAKIPEDKIKPIPLYSTFHRVSLSDAEKARHRMTSTKKAEESLRVKYRNAVLIACIMAAMVLVMMIITWNGASINAVNYKKVVTDQYAAWEQDLSEREAVIREKNAN